MASFDLETSQAELEKSKLQYNEIMKFYNIIKLQAHPQQHFPSIEAKLHEVEGSIERHTILIENYKDLVNTMKRMQDQEEVILEEVRRVRARYE